MAISDLSSGFVALTVLEWILLLVIVLLLRFWWTKINQDYLRWSLYVLVGLFALLMILIGALASTSCSSTTVTIRT
jgi:hypothetical protein